MTTPTPSSSILVSGLSAGNRSPRVHGVGSEVRGRYMLERLDQRWADRSFTRSTNVSRAPRRRRLGLDGHGDDDETGSLAVLLKIASL